MNNFSWMLFFLSIIASVVCGIWAEQGNFGEATWASLIAYLSLLMAFSNAEFPIGIFVVILGIIAIIFALLNAYPLAIIVFGLAIAMLYLKFLQWFGLLLLAKGGRRDG